MLSLSVKYILKLTTKSVEKRLKNLSDKFHQLKGDLNRHVMKRNKASVTEKSGVGASLDYKEGKDLKLVESQK